MKCLVVYFAPITFDDLANSAKCNFFHNALTRIKGRHDHHQHEKTHACTSLSCSPSYLERKIQALLSCVANCLRLWYESKSSWKTASWYITNSDCRAIMWAIYPLFTCLPSSICLTVAGPYRSDFIQHKSSPLSSMNARIARSWAITICSSPGWDAVLSASDPGELFAASLLVGRALSQAK